MNRDSTHMKQMLRIKITSKLLRSLPIEYRLMIKIVSIHFDDTETRPSQHSAKQITLS